MATHCGKDALGLNDLHSNMQSSDSATTDGEIESVPDPLDTEACDQAWQSISKSQSQSAQDVHPPASSYTERAPEVSSLKVRSPSTSQNAKVVDSPRSPSHLLHHSQTASPPTAATSMRADSQSIGQCAAVSETTIREPPRQTRLQQQHSKASPRKSPTAIKQSSMKALESLAADSVRAGDTLHLDSAAPSLGHNEAPGEISHDLSSLANFALYVTADLLRV